MYSCTNCDAQFAKWTGRCDQCDKWGTVQEETSTGSSFGSSAKKGGSVKALKSKKLSEVTQQNEHVRISTQDKEVDRVLGGGIVKGSLVLLAGEPGVGKSTLVAKIAGSINNLPPSHLACRQAGGGNEGGCHVLYISGEESPSQLSARFSRLNCTTQHVNVLDPVPVESICATLEKEQPSLAIVDSVQTLTSSVLDGAPGTPALVRYATTRLLETAKRTGVSILLVGQVTKDGSVAGPKTLEHLVDVVLSLDGDPVHAYRMLRSGKNRFGATDEVGVFEMTSEGLIAVENPSERFLEERTTTPGSVIAATVEGSRVFLVEVQALVEKSSYGTPVRRASGFDQNRLQMLVAILSKHAGLKLGEQDVYVNVIGGMRLKEPAADLAVCAALVSAAKNQSTPTPTVFLGEVGLGGETRSIPMLDKRLGEIARLNIPTAVIPSKGKLKKTPMEVRRIGSIKEL